MHRQGDICRTAQPAPTIIMKLVTRWSDQHHPSTPGSVCPHFLEASSGYCASTDRVLHKMEQLMSGMQSGHSAFPLCANHSSHKTTQECAWDTVIDIFREELQSL